ncbi:MAG: SpoIIE family protein phosphatase [Pirellulales bacterium]|nr:SpoIIE family protein phosphatase [Pirellulales bacterium]
MAPIQTPVNLSIRTKLVLAIGVPLLAAYAGMTVLEFRLGKREALAMMRTHLTELVARRAAELDSQLASAEQLAQTLATLVAASPDLSADRARALVRDSLEKNPKVFGMCMAFEPGALPGRAERFAPYYCRDGSGGLRYVDIAETIPGFTELDWYRPARTAKKPFWTEPYFDTGIGERIMCTCTAPVVQEGRFRGLVTADVLSDDLLTDIERTRIGSGYCILTSRKGTFISHPDASLVMRESVASLARQHGLDELASAAARMTEGKEGVCRIHDYRTGDAKWMVYAPVKSTGWSLAAIVSESEVMAPMYERLARSIAILLGGLAGILLIVMLVSERATRPIGRLVEAAESLARGNLDARVVGATGGDEIARLARTFNTMVSDLKTNVEGRISEEAARKKVEGELKAAREIQSSLLPAMLPSDPDRGFTLHAVNAPARSVAGDFFDFFQVDPRRLALVMADVSGKGVPAAMYMAVVRTQLRDFASPDKTPAQIVAEVNRCLARENDRGMFVTLFFGYYDVIEGDLTYVNAGHNPPYVVRTNGALETLEPTGPLVAPFPEAAFEQGQCRLAAGELLVLFTDGVTEAGAAQSGLFGEERLERLLAASAGSPVAEICQQVIQAASDFSNGDLPDDATVLVLRRT